MARYCVVFIAAFVVRAAPIALAGALGACGSGGPAHAPVGADVRQGAGGAPDGAPDGSFEPVDASVADQPHDAAPVFSCVGGALSDGGVTCIQFDPGYGEPAAVCGARQSGPVGNAPCSLDGSAGGCHVATGTSGYTIWMYGRQTSGALIVRCQQLGESYVSADFDVTADASAHATGAR